MKGRLAAHPELPALGLVVAAWAYMGWEGFQAGRWTCCAPDAAALQEAGAWLLMVIAMMLPATLPNVREIAWRSYRTMRLPLTLAYVAGYVVTWGFAGTLLIVFRPLPPEWRASVAASLCLAAVAWAFHPARRALFQLCHRRIPLRPVGPGAYADVLRQAAKNSTGCIGGCWPLMLACALTHHHFVMMIGGAALALTERRMFRFHPGPLAAGAFCMALWTLTV